MHGGGVVTGGARGAGIPPPWLLVFNLTHYLATWTHIGPCVVYVGGEGTRGALGAGTSFFSTKRLVSPLFSVEFTFCSIAVLAIGLNARYSLM